MKFLKAATLVGFVAALGACQVIVEPLDAFSSDPPPPSRAQGTVYRPGSSIQVPGDEGIKAHTNVERFVPGPGTGMVQPPAATFYAPKSSY